MPLIVTLAVILIAQDRPKPLGTFDESKGNPSRPLQSAGIRGTIDAGGYAAAAAVKTQTEFYEQLIRLQVAALRPAWAPRDPCSGPDSLRRPAITLLARGEFAAAATALETLLRTNDEPATRQLLGLAYEGTGQLEAATEQFRTAAATRPDDAGLFAQGVTLLFEGNVDRAEAVFRRAGPTALARLGLGAALFQRGQVTEALGLFLDAESAPYGFIAIAVRSADPATLTRSIYRLTALTRRSPKDGSALYALACALTAAAGGAPDGPQTVAIEARLKEAVALDPQLADAHFRLAGFYAAHEDLPPAIAEYRAALGLNPRLVEARYRLGQLYIRSRQPQLASEQFELHRQLRAQEKNEIENGKIPVRLPDVAAVSCH